MESFFYIFSFIAIFSTCLVIVQNNPIYALFYLIISFLSMSMIFFSLGAFFIGALEVIIYAGAIMVLFVFVIMMLNLGKKNDLKEEKYLHTIFWIGSIFLSFILLCLMVYVIFFLKDYKISRFITNSKLLGISLFKTYPLLVELSSMLLLSSLVVVFHLGKYKFLKKHALENKDVRKDNNI